MQRIGPSDMGAFVYNYIEGTGCLENIAKLINLKQVVKSKSFELELRSKMKKKIMQNLEL